MEIIKEGFHDEMPERHIVPLQTFLPAVRTKKISGFHLSTAVQAWSGFPGNGLFSFFNKGSFEFQASNLRKFIKSNQISLSWNSDSGLHLHPEF